MSGTPRLRNPPDLERTAAQRGESLRRLPSARASESISKLFSGRWRLPPVGFSPRRQMPEILSSGPDRAAATRSSQFREESGQMPEQNRNIFLVFRNAPRGAAGNSRRPGCDMPAMSAELPTAMREGPAGAARRHEANGQRIFAPHTRGNARKPTACATHEHPAEVIRKGRRAARYRTTSRDIEVLTQRRSIFMKGFSQLARLLRMKGLKRWQP